MSPAGGARLFVAADSPADMKEAFRALRPELARQIPGARWSRPEGLHLTLKFLGATPNERIAVVSEAVGAAARAARPFRLRTGGIGRFEARGRLRVLWIALDGDVDAAVSLKGSIESSLEPLGFPREGRDFHPHLTLARFDPERRAVIAPGVPESLGRSLGGADFGVEEIVLFESLLSSGGSRYLARARFPLGAEHEA